MKKSQARLNAIANGQTVYVPENPCARGHKLRSVSGVCVECRRLREKARYYADPEKTKAIVSKKYQKHAEKLKAKRRLAYENNKEQEKLVAKKRSAEWRKNNPNHVGTKISKIQWKIKNPHKVRAETVKRRVAKISRTPSWLTDEDHWMIEQAYDLARQRSMLFGFAWHVDHVLPLQGKFVCGLHVPENLQVIPWFDNVKKANRYLPA